MKRTRAPVERITAAPQQAESGVAVGDLYRQLRISEVTVSEEASGDIHERLD